MISGYQLVQTTWLKDGMDIDSCPESTGQKAYQVVVMRLPLVQPVIQKCEAEVGAKNNKPINDHIGLHS